MGERDGRVFYIDSTESPQPLVSLVQRRTPQLLVQALLPAKPPTKADMMKSAAETILHSATVAIGFHSVGRDTLNSVLLQHDASTFG